MRLCGLGAELTLHLSWAFSERDLGLVPHLPRLARILEPVAGGCVGEVLLTLDPLEKAPGALEAAESSALGVELRRQLRGALAEAAATLGAARTRVEAVDYGNATVLRTTLRNVLGLPQERFRETLPLLRKHTLAHAYALLRCRTEYLLHICNT